MTSSCANYATLHDFFKQLTEASASFHKLLTILMKYCEGPVTSQFWQDSSATMPYANCWPVFSKLECNGVTAVLH